MVFKYCDDSDREEHEPTFVCLQYKLKALAIQYKEGESSISYLADYTDDGWMLIELCQFVGYKKVVKLEVLFECLIDYNDILLEGIQFLPVDNTINDESIHEVENAQKVDTNREQKLPDDYREIIKMAKDKVPHKITNKDLYTRLSNGILTDRGQSFFYLDKYGMKCCMHAATTVLRRNGCFRLVSTDQSRFEKVAECESGDNFFMELHINSHMLSPNTTYATYLVYKLPEASHWAFEAPLEVEVPPIFRSGHNKGPFTFLTIPKNEVINLVQDDEDCGWNYQMNPMNRPKMEAIPRKRKDGWMETPIWAFVTDAPAKTIYKEFVLRFYIKEEFTGLIVQGVETRPK